MASSRHPNTHNEPLLSRKHNNYKLNGKRITKEQYYWLKDNIDVEGGEGEYGDEWLNIFDPSDAHEVIEKRIVNIIDNSNNDEIDYANTVRNYFKIADYNNEEDAQFNIEGKMEMLKTRQKIDKMENVIQQYADKMDMLVRGGVNEKDVAIMFRAAIYEGDDPVKLQMKHDADRDIVAALKQLTDWVIGGKKRKQTRKRKKSKRKTNKKRKTNARGKSRKSKIQLS
jgi:hypothetical protein